MIMPRRGCPRPRPCAGRRGGRPGGRPRRDEPDRVAWRRLVRQEIAHAFLEIFAFEQLCDGYGDEIRIAQVLGPITERAAQRILSDLLAGGYVSKVKVGRRNRYTVNRNGHLRHPIFRELEIGPLIDILRQDTEAPL